MLLAGVGLGKLQLPCLLSLAGDGHDQKVPLGGVEGVLDRVRKTGLNSLTHHQTVHHDLDRVLQILLQTDLLGKIVEASVNAYADVAALSRALQNLLVRALLGAHHGCQHHKALALGKLENAVNDLVGGLLTDLLAADRAVRNADAGVKQTQIVVDLRDRAHRGARILGGGLLVDGDRGRKPLHRVQVRLVQLTQEHTGVGGKRLHEAAMPLGIERIKGERGLSRARKAGQNDQLVARNVYVNVF